ncbi:hypothetical protein CsSME_00051827 [Camellia sinensis var. sinensis]
MSKKGATRRELLDRWRGIEDEDDDDDDDAIASSDPSRSRRLRQLKEECCRCFLQFETRSCIAGLKTQLSFDGKFEHFNSLSLLGDISLH